MRNKGLELEPHNFRIDSTGWGKIQVDGKEYLVNPEGDIWQLFFIAQNLPRYSINAIVGFTWIIWIIKVL